MALNSKMRLLPLLPLVVVAAAIAAVDAALADDVSRLIVRCTSLSLVPY